MYQPTDNLYNFRDLGGLKLRNGGETRYGVFARSNIILDITPEETEKMHASAAKLREIIDGLEI